MSSPTRTFETEIIGIRPSRRVAFECFLDGQRLLCVHVGADMSGHSALAIGQRILVRGRPSQLARRVFEAEAIIPLTCRRNRATRPADFHPRG